VLGDIRDQLHVLASGERWDEVVELEHEAHVLAPVAREDLVVGPEQILLAVVDLPGGRRIEAPKDVEQRRLAAPRRPEQHGHLRGVEIEVDPAQCLYLHVAHAVGLGEAARNEHGLRAVVGCRDARTSGLGHGDSASLPCRES
jgi:hypothetical protein